MEHSSDQPYVDPLLLELFKKVPVIKITNQEEAERWRNAGGPMFKQDKREPRGDPMVTAQPATFGPLSGWLFTPQAGNDVHHEAAGLMYLHGGVHLMGNALIHETKCNALVKQTGVTIFAPDQRWSPEHLFPELLDDTIKTFAAFATRPGANPTQQCIGGTTGGGSLAISYALWNRDHRGEANVPSLAAIVPEIPFLAPPHLSGYSMQEDCFNPIEKIWSRETAEYAANAYMPEGVDDPHHYGWPIEHPSFQGLAPAQFTLSHHDLARDAAMEVALRILKESANGVEIQLLRGSFHGHVGLAPVAPITKQSVRNTGDFLVRTLGLA